MKTLWLVLVTLVLAGCSHYWYRAQNSTLTEFTKDHRECLEKGTPIPNQPGYVIIDQGTFRTCLAVRGWRRAAHNRGTVPPGHFRGVEDFDDLRPIAVERLPMQPDSAHVDTTDPRYFIQPDAQRPPAPR